jgi:translin
VDHSGQIADAGALARESLEAKHAAREATLDASRRAIRACAMSIRAVHRREFHEARELIAVAAAYLSESDAALDGHPDVRYAGFVHDAKKEFVEANLTLAFVADHAVPTAAELGVEVQAYLNGMAEAASELRRQVLDCLRADDGAEAERLLALMDDVYAVLITVDYPDALTGGLRRTTDALRAVLERTRGDATNALVAARLRDAIERQRAEGPTPG